MAAVIQGGGRQGACLHLLHATQSYESDLRGIKAHRKQVLSGSATERKRKVLQFLVAAGIATPKGKLTSKYR